MKIDENGEYYCMGFDGTSPAPLRVDPITDRLLVEITNEVYPHTQSVSRIDANNQNSALVFDGNNIVPILCNPNNGRVLIDLLIT